MSPSPRHWQMAEPADSVQIAALREGLGCSDLLARLLVQRGHSGPREAERFLHPSLEHFHDPASLAGMPKAVGRLAGAVGAGEAITIFGDYDVDGVSSTALLVNFLRSVGAKVDFYIPHRIKEGYGLSMEGIEQALAQGTRVIVTVDNGVAHPEEVARAQAGGIDVIVTDHHQIPESGTPAFAMVNPHQTGCAYPYKILAGAGIALNLALALRQGLREAGHFGGGRPEPNLREFLDLACLGTIADLVPLKDVNRVIARFGVEQMGRTRWPGLAALVGYAGVEPARLSAADVAFQIAPRINAGGRLSDATDAVELLTTADAARAGMIAATLDAHNRERRQIERAMTEEAVARIEKDGLLNGRRSLVIWQEGWHPGVIGIVAARLVERYYRPTIVVGILEGQGKGSARSIRGYNVYQGIKSAAEHLKEYGGHAQAAGLSVDPARLGAFAEAFEKNVQEWTGEEHFGRRLAIDAEVDSEALGAGVADEIARLEPFGMENPEPLIVLRGVRLEGARLLKGRHLKARLEGAGEAVDIIYFGAAEQHPPEQLAPAGGPSNRAEGRLLACDLAGHLEWNYWRGSRKLQFRVREMKLDSESDT